MKKENAQQGAQSVSVSDNEYSTIHPIANAGEPIAMSSREVAALTSKRHADVMRDVRVMLDELEKDVRNFAHIYFDAQNREQTEYRLDKDLTLTLVSGYNIKLRHAIIQRLDELERASQPRMPRTRTEAIEMMLEQSRMLDHQQAYIEETKHDVEFAKAVSSSKDGKKLEEFAKVVGIGRNKLFAYLRKAKILQTDNVREHSDTHNVPYQRYLDAKYFTVSRKAYQSSSGRHRGHTTLITGKGELWLTKQLIKDELLPAPAQKPPAHAHQL